MLRIHLTHFVVMAASGSWNHRKIKSLVGMGGANKETTVLGWEPPDNTSKDEGKSGDRLDRFGRKPAAPLHMIAFAIEQWVPAEVALCNLWRATREKHGRLTRRLR